MRIAITGGAGFIGFRLTKNLISRGHQVVVIDNLQNINLQWDDAGVELLNHDITKPLAKDYGLSFDALVHLAAMHYIPDCEKEPLECVSSNVGGTVNILNYAKYLRVKQFIFASSAAVYKPSIHPHKETDILDPIDVYGKSKFISEELIKMSGHDFLILRLFNVVGKGDRTKHFIPEVVSQVLNQSGIIQLGNLNSARDYIHVLDVVNCITAAIENKFTNEIVNIGSGQSKTGLQVLQDLQAITGEEILVATDPEKLRNLDRPNLVADTSRYHELFGGAKLSLQDALIEMLNDQAR